MRQDLILIQLRAEEIPTPGRKYERQKHNQHSGLSQLDNLQDATDGRENGQKTQSQAGYLPSVQVYK
ncbi:uncharacterized protein Dana_GF27473, isoform A [Drosophila ananassae]|uniref:Uncharacterized protein, isoform A n=1 Tax=Drosophila ananassae TaxID=7217 RepID=A0A0P8XEH0_DROAN|nr:uncharacterized protein Dana_GF27473, isoform A [Drosophila ananassae]